MPFLLLAWRPNVPETIRLESPVMRHRAALFIRQPLLPSPHLTNLNPSLLATLLHRKTTPFGWGGDFDQDHQDMPDQDMQPSSTRPINHAGINLDLLLGTRNGRRQNRVARL